MSHMTSVPLVYFGKIPMRGDFVRSAQQSALVHALDRWLSQGIELMAVDARWKEIYDRTQPLSFAFLGVRNRVVLAGHLLTSVDSSGRRFPFVAGAGFDVVQPDEFIGRSPMVLSRPWRLFERFARRAQSMTEAEQVLGEMSQTQVELETAPRAYEAGRRDFADSQTLGSLQNLLEQAGHRVDVRRTLLALGLLLQPVRNSGSSQLDKGLRLPLPMDPLYQPFVAAWWMELMLRFVRHADFELALFVSRSLNESAPTLSLGFSGGSPAMLHAALDPQIGEQVFVDLRSAEWAEDLVLHDYALRRLSGGLQQASLSLRRAQMSFHEAFLGE